MTHTTSNYAGCGRTQPDPAEDVFTSDGVVVPKGKGVPSLVTKTSLLYNEYPPLNQPGMSLVSVPPVSSTSILCLLNSVQVYCV